MSEIYCMLSNLVCASWRQCNAKLMLKCKRAPLPLLGPPTLMGLPVQTSKGYSTCAPAPISTYLGILLLRPRPCSHACAALLLLHPSTLLDPSPTWQAHHLGCSAQLVATAAHKECTSPEISHTTLCDCHPPGMHVSVVNSYAATSELVPVSCCRRDDFPTEGKPR